MGARGSWAVGRLALGRLGFGGEEMPHRAPDVLEVVERVTAGGAAGRLQLREQLAGFGGQLPRQPRGHLHVAGETDRKSTRLNSSHLVISYAVFCLKKKREQSSGRLDETQS